MYSTSSSPGRKKTNGVRGADYELYQLDGPTTAGSVTDSEPLQRLIDLRARIREESELEPSDSAGDPVINITITLGHGLPDYVDPPVSEL